MFSKVEEKVADSCEELILCNLLADIVVLRIVKLGTMRILNVKYFMNEETKN